MFWFNSRLWAWGYQEFTKIYGLSFDWLIDWLIGTHFYYLHRYSDRLQTGLKPTSSCVPGWMAWSTKPQSQNNYSNFMVTVGEIILDQIIVLTYFASWWRILLLVLDVAFEHFSVNSASKAGNLFVPFCELSCPRVETFIQSSASSSLLCSIRYSQRVFESANSPRFSKKWENSDKLKFKKFKRCPRRASSRTENYLV